LTLRLAVHTLFGKARSNLGKNILHPQKYALPYTCAWKSSAASQKIAIAYVGEAVYVNSRTNVFVDEGKDTCKVGTVFHLLGKRTQLCFTIICR